MRKDTFFESIGMVAMFAFLSVMILVLWLQEKLPDRSRRRTNGKSHSKNVIS